VAAPAPAQLCADRLAKPPGGRFACSRWCASTNRALARDIGVTAAEELLTLFPAHGAPCGPE